jgi:hypothetical protein
VAKSVDERPPTVEFVTIGGVAPLMAGGVGAGVGVAAGSGMPDVVKVSKDPAIRLRRSVREHGER